jgi:hypothetical protein
MQLAFDGLIVHGQMPTTDALLSGSRLVLVHWSRVSKLCHRATSHVFSGPAELSMTTVNRTDSRSEGTVVVCPNGGWQLSAAYMSAVSVGCQGELNGDDNGSKEAQPRTR